jgi:hypothetical protein
MSQLRGPNERAAGWLTRVLGALIGFAGGEPPWMVRQVLWGCVVIAALSIAALCALLPLGLWLLVREAFAFL